MYNKTSGIVGFPPGVGKEIMVQGKPTPGAPYPPYLEGTKIDFHFKTWITATEEEIDDTRKMGNPMTLILGKKFKLEIWELMLQSMIPGQVARYTVTRNHVYSYPVVSKAIRQSLCGQPPESPSHHCCGMMQQGLGYEDLDRLMATPQDLSFLLEIVKVSPPGSYEKETWQMSESEKLQSVPVLQSEGNSLFAKGDFDSAEKKYFEAIARLEQLLLKEHPASDEATQLEDQKCPLLLNYALTLMKRNEFYQAISHLDSALKLQPNNVKGLFRRGKCHYSVGNYEEAGRDLGEALRLDPTIKNAVTQVQTEIAKVKQKQDDADRTKFKRIFEAPPDADASLKPTTQVVDKGDGA